MDDARWPQQLDRGLAELELDQRIDDAARSRLRAFLGLLGKWNRAYNLTAVRDPAEMVARQLLDSLAILPFVRAPEVLDVGAGGGLPGVPLAIVLPHTRFTLLDSNSKKTRFLTQCVLELGLDNVEVVHSRAEAFRPPSPFTQITSRAFTSLASLVDWCGHMLAGEGQFLAMKGQFPDDEVLALPGGWRVSSHHPLQVPGVTGERHLLVVERAATTGGQAWRAS